MARKSTDSLSIVTTLPGQRLRPPARLSAEAVGIWRAVVSGKPAAWFAADTAAVLEAYVLAVVGHRVVSKQIRGLEEKSLATEDGLAAYDRLLRMQDRQARVLASMATKLRLTQQSRYTPGAAATASAKAKGARPWDA
jgi:hypothetical protein